MFSHRTNWPLSPNRLYVLLRERRARELPVLDLTESNPTRCGFALDADAILAPLLNPRSLCYEPDPRGLLVAREAVTQYYADCGVRVEPDQVFLTASTSEAYSFVFRLLANPGEKVLVPQPSYPLFDFLGGLNDVAVSPYPLDYQDGWGVDLEALTLQADAGTRAILVVHPNNPTGSYIRPHELRHMVGVCRRNQAAIIADEVFADYGVATDAERVLTHAAQAEVLTFTLSGLSKICALPQMKLAWIVVTGPADLRRQAQSRLEVIADTYLSLSAPVALAAPAWLAGRGHIQSQIRERVQANLRMLDELLVAGSPVSRFKVEGGWYAILRVPATRSDEEWALALLAEGVYVHPGHFYDFRSDGFLVVSLLPTRDIFDHAINKLISCINAYA